MNILPFARRNKLYCENVLIRVFKNRVFLKWDKKISKKELVFFVKKKTFFGNFEKIVWKVN